MAANANGSAARSTGDNNPPEPTSLQTAEELELSLADQIEALRVRAFDLINQFSAAPAIIESDDQYQRYVALAARMNALIGDIEDKRTSVKEPYKVASAKIDGLYKLDSEGKGKKRRKLRTEVDAAIKDVKARLSSYDTAAYETALEQRATEFQHLAASLKQDDIELAAQPANDDLLYTRKSEYGGMALRSLTVDYEIQDESAIPRELCSPDPKKIKAMIDKGARDIPGISVFESVSTMVRGNG